VQFNINTMQFRLNCIKKRNKDRNLSKSLEIERVNFFTAFSKYLIAFKRLQSSTNSQFEKERKLDVTCSESNILPSLVLINLLLDCHLKYFINNNSFITFTRFSIFTKIMQEFLRPCLAIYFGPGFTVFPHHELVL